MYTLGQCFAMHLDTFVVLSVWHLGKHFYISFRDNTVDVIILSLCCMWQGRREVRKWGGKYEKKVR